MAQYTIMTDGVDIFRDGVRSGTWVTDKALTVLGFAGAESTDDGVTGDWVNLEILDVE